MLPFVNPPLSVLFLLPLVFYLLCFLGSFSWLLYPFVCLCALSRLMMKPQLGHGVEEHNERVSLVSFRLLLLSCPQDYYIYRHITLTGFVFGGSLRRRFFGLL